MPVRAIAVAVMIAAGLAALIASGSSKPGGSGGGHHKTSAAAPHGGSAAKDVAIVSCTTSNGQPAAKVRIVNHSSKTSNYIVTVAFDSSDGNVHYRSTVSSTSDVGSGETVIRNTAVSKSSSNSGTFSCKVDSVERWAS